MAHSPHRSGHLSRSQRAGHVGGFWIGYLVILFAFAFLKGLLPPRFGPLAWGGASAIGLLYLTFWLLRREHRTVNDVGLRWSARSPRRFVAGLLLGTAVSAMMLLAISLIAGPLEISRVTAPSSAAIMVIVATTLALGIMEEVGFRAYSLWTLVESFGIWWGQLVVAGAFTLMHLVYGWSIGTALLGVFPSALLFGAAAIATRGVACPLGVHVAMNLCRWLMGETADPGVWRIGASGAAEHRVGAAAPAIGFGVVIAAAVAVTLWSVWRARRSPQANRSALAG
jgi:membrane protease YdiL (CAAX protease family)